MDIKTLSTIIGHSSTATTLDIHSHSTDLMRQDAAWRIDREIAGSEPPEAPQPTGESLTLLPGLPAREGRETPSRDSLCP